MRRSLATGIGTLSVILSLCAFSWGSVGLVGGVKSLHSLTIQYPTASGLVPGSDVLEAGSRIGTISDIQAADGDGALVTVQIDDPHWPLHQGLQAAIRPKSLLGEKYVDFHDGKATGPGYDPSQLVRAPSDSVPVELDQFLNSLDPATRASARVLLNDLGAGVAGQGQTLNDAIKAGTQDLQYLAVTGKTLNNRDPDLDRILLGLDGLLQRITTNDQLTQLSQLIGNGQQTLNAIETQRQAFSRQFVDAQLALADLNTGIDTAVPALRNILSVAPHLLATVKAEGDQLAYLGQVANNPATTQALIKGLLEGPTSSGGATEIHPDGSRSAIFRICLLLPSLPIGGSDQSCTGNGFTPSAANPIPAAFGGGDGGAQSLATLMGA